jgi:DHA2 family multidrug resistance protein
MNRPLNRRMITLSIMTAAIMQTLDSTIANVALPHMQGALSASQDQIAWVLTAYIIAAAIATPLTSWVVDRFGQKNIFVASVIGFIIASALCGMANSMTEMVTARLLQGIFGAALVPMSQMVLMDINQPHKQGPAMAIWGMGVMVGPVLGPTLGGWLTESYDWRWVFYINVPIGALAAYGIWRFMRPVPGMRRMYFDTFGFASLSLTVGMLQILLDRGQQNDWFSSTETWIEAVMLAVALIYFVAHTALSRADRSFFDYRLLKNGNYISGLLLIFVIGVVLFATRALTPTMLQNLLGYPAATAGLVTAPPGLATMASMLIAGRLMGKLNPRQILLIGLSLSAIPLWQMTHYALDLSQSDIIWPGVLQGLGVGFVFVPLSALTFVTLSQSMRPQGTAIFSLIRNIGSSTGISMVQTMLVRNTAISHADLVEHITYANPAWNQSAAAAAFDVTQPSGVAALDAVVAQQASMIAYLDDFRLMLYLTLATIPLLILIRTPRRIDQPADTHVVME